jgi:acyl-coenzyme A thioesterase PaaI-like protein
MRYRVTAKQENSRMCFVCGLKNPYGLYTAFYELESGELLGVFKPREAHQSYPGRLHGGIAATILDETIGRSINVGQKEIWGVTVEISTRYRKPIPLNEEIRVLGRIERETRRSFEGSGEILLPDGSVAVEGRGKYIKLPIDQIADFDHQGEDWKVVPKEGDLKEVEI